MIDILDRYFAEISEQRKLELLGRYLSLEYDSLFSILGDRLTFGPRDDWELEAASPEQELVEKGRIWFEEVTPRLRKLVHDARRDDSQIENNISLAQAAIDVLKAADEEWPVPILILAILVVKEEFLTHD